MFVSPTLAPGLGLSLAPYPRSCRMGLVPLSEAPLCALQPLALPFLVVLTEAACLRRFLDLSIVLPWPWVRFQGHLLCTFSVSRLSFELGEFFWLGFGLCLTILLTPWSCRRAYCGPHCGRESARALASLLGLSPSGVRHLSRVGSSVGGTVGVAPLFHPSLLLGGVLVRLCGGSCCRSLAMS